MAVLHASDLALTFNDGETLFHDVSLSLDANRTALVGSNGVGKSQLGALLAGEREPTRGRVSCEGRVLRCQQQAAVTDPQSSLRIVDWLEVGAAYDALCAIEAGSASPRDFDALAERWSLRDDIARLLDAQGLALKAHDALSSLSGGERARLRLGWYLSQAPDVLILDEPSNHLDARARRWLRSALHAFTGQVLLITHDRALLRDVTEIWELDSRGLTVYGGNLDHWQQQKARMLAALERQMQTVRSDAKQHQRRAQEAEERAARRASRGRRARADGSQPKILMDAKRERAASATASRRRVTDARSQGLSKHLDALRERHADSHEQHLTFLAETHLARRRVVHLYDAVLPYGNSEPVSIDLAVGDKLAVQGDNGSGKTTLFKVLDGALTLQRGECRVNGSVVILDQHVGMLAPEGRVLDQLLHWHAELDPGEARTLLAGIDLRGDAVLRPVSALSGGEKMKLCLLIVSQHRRLPLLLLDEPDNHLDLCSKQLLAQAIADYPGAVLLVSHDSDFVRDCGIEQRLVLGA